MFSRILLLSLTLVSLNAKAQQISSDGRFHGDGAIDAGSEALAVKFVAARLSDIDNSLIKNPAYRSGSHYVMRFNKELGQLSSEKRQMWTNFVLNERTKLGEQYKKADLKVAGSYAELVARRHYLSVYGASILRALYAEGSSPSVFSAQNLVATYENSRLQTHPSGVTKIIDDYAEIVVETEYRGRAALRSAAVQVMESNGKSPLEAAAEFDRNLSPCLFADSARASNGDSGNNPISR